MPRGSLPNRMKNSRSPGETDFVRTPQFVTRLGSVTRRMHNKSFTVDNQLTILGGRNIGNEYFGLNPKQNFTDFDVHFPSIGPKEIVFEAGGKLYLLGLQSESIVEVNVNVITDQVSLQPEHLGSLHHQD